MRRSCLGLLVAALAGAPSAHAVTITLNAGAGLSGNAAALAAFQRAAASWEQVLLDPIAITLNADFANLGSPSIIGSTSTALVQGPYDLIRNAMVTDGGGDPVLNALPTAATFTALIPAGYTLSGNIFLSTANAKALGFAIGPGADGTITFNDQFNFDLDNSNGVGAGQVDFETVAAHEIGHALGFISAVDQVDIGTPFAISMAPMDLFRFQNDVAGRDPSNLAEFTAFARYLSAGGDAVFDDILLERLLSTGVSQGDGNQASHWKDDGITGNLIGIMDPTLPNAFVENISSSDLRFFDLIGYNVNAVPEPATLGLVSLAFAVGAFAARRRRG